MMFFFYQLLLYRDVLLFYSQDFPSVHPLFYSPSGFRRLFQM